MSLSTQFIYHPENDEFIAAQLLRASNLAQKFDIRGMSIGTLNRPSEDYWNAMKSVDVIVLLVGASFHKIAPFIYSHDNFILAQKGILGVDISSIPDEWGETRKRGNIWLDHSFAGKSMRDIIRIQSTAADADPQASISRNLAAWVNDAYKFANNGYA